MTLQWGLCDFLVDPDTRAVITPAWAQHVRGYGVDLVRATIACASNGAVPTTLYRQGLEIYRTEGIAVQCVFTPSFFPTGVLPAGAHSNMLLNTSGDRFNSLWIDAVTLRAEAVAKALVRFGMTTAIFGNEPNELGRIAPGMVVPPGPKGGALAPSIAAATYWQAGSRMKSAGVPEVYLGALSVLPQTGVDKLNPYYWLWLESFYTGLASAGKHAPYPWDGWCINCEGAWNTSTLGRAIAPLRTVMQKYGDTGSIRITECGWQNGRDLDTIKAGDTLDAITALGEVIPVLSATFFQGPGITPYLGPVEDYTDYGAYQWRQDGTVFIPEGDYRWGETLRPYFSTL